MRPMRRCGKEGKQEGRSARGSGKWSVSGFGLNTTFDTRQPWPFPILQTAESNKRVEQMREWAAKEFTSTNEPGWLANLFLFASLPENMAEIEPRQLFLDPVWYMPSDDDNPVSLLGE